MDTQNSQKKSPRSSKRNRNTAVSNEPASGFDRYGDERFDDPYTDRTPDLVARVRAAREAAQREMESFGDISEYDITIIHGQRKEHETEHTGHAQADLAFPLTSPERKEDES